MTTTTIATAAEAILAIDLGKYKSVACLYRSADKLHFLSDAFWPGDSCSWRAPRWPSGSQRWPPDPVKGNLFVPQRPAFRRGDFGWEPQATSKFKERGLVNAERPS